MKMCGHKREGGESCIMRRSLTMVRLFFTTCSEVHQIGRKRRVGHVARMRVIRIWYKILVRESEGNGLLGRPRRRWEDNMRRYVRDMGWESVHWIHLVQDRDTVMSLQMA
jgi:hypothetical protein